MNKTALPFESSLKPVPLLDPVRGALRARHYSLKTALPRNCLPAGMLSARFRNCQVIKMYNVQTHEYRDFVPKEVLETLQNNLDGKTQNIVE